MPTPALLPCLLVASSLVLIACTADKRAGSPDARGIAAAPASVPPSPSPAAPPRVPSFQRELAPYFVARCANAAGCHGLRKTRHVALDLRATESYRHLVNVPSDERRSAMLVKPGDPDASFVVVKLLGKGLRDREGTAMPREEDDNRPVSPIPFDPDFIDNALVPWIRAGAPNN